MKPFNNEITYEIKEELSSLITTLNNTDNTLLIKINSDSFEVVEKSGYFKMSQIKDYKFIGNLSTSSPDSTELRMKVELRKIGKINFYIVAFFILYGLMGSFYLLFNDNIKGFLFMFLLSIFLGWYLYFRINKGAIVASILLLQKMDFSIEKVKIKN